jgi:cysteinyl-tRNA synthetase
LALLKLFNTISRQKEEFQPLQPGKVGMYSCGPTVYGTPHIGNLRAYIFSDTLRRTLEFLGYEVNQVINITDVGHLTTDSDAGEDKMEKGARAAGKTVWEVAKFYEGQFLEALAALNIKTPTCLPRATEHIAEQIELIEQLTTKGCTYETADGIYFDTAKFPNYGKLSGQNLDEKEAGARVAVKDEKRHPADFALWKFCVGENVDHAMRWPNPPSAQKGEGFPGWHIECSAMSSKYLGKTFDIHTGGIDHIPVHHENEIAQSEAASGQKFVNYWLHCDFMTVDGGKMSKSLGNVFTLADLAERGFEPAAFRYLCLQSHYRSKVNFTWEALKSAEKSLNNMRRKFQQLPAKINNNDESIDLFRDALSDDLNTAVALANFVGALAGGNDQETILEMDKVLGLGFDKLPRTPTAYNPTPEQAKLLAEREEARKNKDFARSDEIRAEFEKAGFEIIDDQNGSTIKEL